MADPLTAAAAASTAAPAAITAGIAAVVLALFGLQLPHLALGCMASLIGLAFAPPSGRLFAVARYAASSTCSAVLGSAVGAQWQLSGAATGAAICTAGILLHVAVGWAAARFGIVADAGLRKAGVEVDQ